MQGKVLLVGGGGGVVGSGVLEELVGRFPVRSFHRSPLATEQGRVEFVPGDISGPELPPRLLDGVGAVVNLIWYREPGPDARFRAAHEGLRRLLQRCREAGVERFVQISLPPGPERWERTIPYFVRRRDFERELLHSGLTVNLVRPSAVFAPRDRLIAVMLGLMRRHRHFPLFGEGEYHLSPIWHRDVGALVASALEGQLGKDVLAGGPERLRYLELLELLARAAGRTPRWVRVSPRTGRWAIRAMNAVGYHALYLYEYDWLLSDTLGFPPPPGAPRPFLPLERFLRGEGDAPASPGWK